MKRTEPANGHGHNQVVDTAAPRETPQPPTPSSTQLLGHQSKAGELRKNLQTRSGEEAA